MPEKTSWDIENESCCFCSTIKKGESESACKWYKKCIIFVKNTELKIALFLFLYGSTVVIGLVISLINGLFSKFLRSSDWEKSRLLWRMQKEKIVKYKKCIKLGLKNTNVEYTEKFHKLLPFNARIEIRSIRTIEKFILYRSFLSM